MQFSPQTRPFFSRLVIVSIGALIASFALYSWNHGFYWLTLFNAMMGRLGPAPALFFVFVGIAIILFGIFSPRREEIPPKEQKPFSRYEWKKHGYWKRLRKR